MKIARQSGLAEPYTHTLKHSHTSEPATANRGAMWRPERPMPATVIRLYSLCVCTCEAQLPETERSRTGGLRHFHNTVSALVSARTSSRSVRCIFIEHNRESNAGLENSEVRTVLFCLLVECRFFLHIYCHIAWWLESSKNTTHWELFERVGRSPGRSEWARILSPRLLVSDRSIDLDR